MDSSTGRAVVPPTLEATALPDSVALAQASDYLKATAGKCAPSLAREYLLAVASNVERRADELAGVLLGHDESDLREERRSRFSKGSRIRGE